MTPCSWAASRASAICLAMGSASSSGMGPCLMRSASVGPSTSSRTRARVPFGLLDAVNLRDVRMVQAGKNLRLSLKPSEPIRISGKRLGQDLQRDLSIQLGISRLIDLAHAPLVDEGRDLVVAESGTDLEGHSSAILCVQSSTAPTLPAANCHRGPCFVVMPVNILLPPFGSTAKPSTVATSWRTMALAFQLFRSSAIRAAI